MTGQLFFSNDTADIREFVAKGGTVVALVDDVEQYKYTCAIMGVLLPPYEVLSLEIDGRLEEAANGYYYFLMGKINQIAHILAAMNMGKNVLLFVPKDESTNFDFVSVIFAFFMNVFGIRIGSLQESFGQGFECVISDDPMFAARRADALFTNNLISFEQYCMMMPSTVMPSENACAIIMRSLNYNFQDMNTCIYYCKQYIDAVHSQRNKPFCPAFRVKMP